MALLCAGTPRTLINIVFEAPAWKKEFEKDGKFNPWERQPYLIQDPRGRTIIWCNSLTFDALMADRRRRMLSFSCSLLFTDSVMREPASYAIDVDDALNVWIQGTWKVPELAPLLPAGRASVDQYLNVIKPVSTNAPGWKIFSKT